MPLKTSWVTSANDADHPFPLNNLPYGVFSTEGGPNHTMWRGDRGYDPRRHRCRGRGLDRSGDEPLFDLPFWNPLMEEGPAVWAALRER